MQIITTCRTCKRPLPTTGQVTHDECPIKLTRIEQLTHDWISAVEFGNTQLEHQLHQQMEQHDTQPPRLLDAALRYASWGWLVFPLMPHSKTPATRRGLYAATTDHDQIRAWWTRKPDCNIGLPAGHQFDVIDIDLPHGLNAYLELATTNLQAHGQVATASGGIHLYTLPTGHKNTVGKTTGIDYRGLGGYVVAPPSTLGPRGRSWSWTHHPSPTITGTAQ